MKLATLFFGLAVISLIAVALIVIFVGDSKAAPFLVCDPYPEDVGVTHFEVIIDNGQPEQVPYSLHPDGNAIVYDMEKLDPGAHVFNEIRAVNERGKSDPVPFDLVPIPGSASGLSIRP